MAFSLKPIHFVLFEIHWKKVLCVGTIEFFALKLEPILLFTNVIGVFICKFSVRGLSLERIYRELRVPPLLYRLWRQPYKINLVLKKINSIFNFLVAHYLKSLCYTTLVKSMLR